MQPGRLLPNGWVFGKPVNLGPAVNSRAGEGSPALSADGLTLFFASKRPGGLGAGDLWRCTRASRSEPFGKPVNLGPTVNSRFNEAALSPSTDGLTLVFVSERPGGEGEQDLWLCTRKSPSKPFGKPVNLGPTVNSRAGEWNPALSADGLTLFFASDRPGGLGAADLWKCTRKSRSKPFSKPVNLGPTVNSRFKDATPSLSTDGLTLVFASLRPGGLGASDLWMCTRKSPSKPFGKPVNLGPTVNSRAAEWTPALSADGLTLLFSSDRPGGLGGVDLWMVRAEEQPEAGKQVAATVLLHAAVAAKTPVPTGPELEKARQMVQEVYRERYESAEASSEKTALAKELLDQAAKSKDAPATHFALLQAARDMAALDGDAATALRVIDKMAETFDIDAMAMRVETLEVVRGNAASTSRCKVLAEHTLPLIEGAVDEDDYETADRLVKIALAAGLRSRDYALRKQIAERAKWVTDLADKYGAMHEALSVLKDNPVDPKSNLAVGKWYCFVKGEWDKGIPMLALGADPALKALAAKELEGADSAEAQVALGDGWWDLAEKKAGEEKDAWLLRAGYWYKQAEPKLASGLAKARIERRLEEIAGITGPISEPLGPHARPSGTRRRGATVPPKVIPATINTELRLPRRGGPYRLTGQVRITKQGALLLERGTTVMMAPGAALTVEGRLNSYGGEDEFARFLPGIPGAAWNTILLPKGSHHVIERIEVRGAAAGLTVHGDAQVTDCIFAQNKIGIVARQESGKKVFQNCWITNNQSDGVNWWGHNIYLERCTIASNGGVGLNLTYYGSPRIISCEFLRNKVGIQSNLYETRVSMESSNLVGNGLAIVLKTKDNCTCQGNYWGTDDPQRIAASIVDGNDQVGLGFVEFEDFARKEIADAGCSLRVPP